MFFENFHISATICKLQGSMDITKIPNLFSLLAFIKKY